MKKEPFLIFLIILNVILIFYFVTDVKITILLGTNANLFVNGGKVETQYDKDSSFYEATIRSAFLQKIKFEIKGENLTYKKFSIRTLFFEDTKIHVFLEKDLGKYSFAKKIYLGTSSIKDVKLRADSLGNVWMLCRISENQYNQKSEILVIKKGKSKIDKFKLNYYPNIVFDDFDIDVENNLVLYDRKYIYNFDKIGNLISKYNVPSSVYAHPRYGLSAGKDGKIYLIGGEKMAIFDKNEKIEIVNSKRFTGRNYLSFPIIRVTSNGEILSSDLNYDSIYKYSEGKLTHDFIKPEKDLKDIPTRLNIGEIYIDDKDNIHVLVYLREYFSDFKYKYFSVLCYNKNGDLISSTGGSVPAVRGAYLINYSQNLINPEYGLLTFAISQNGEIFLIDLERNKIFIKVFTPAKSK